MPTKKKKPTPKTYQAHRERQWRRIVEAAEKLFDEQGVDRVTMAEITSASGVRASTTYQYFANKDEIVWALLREILEESRERAQQRVETAKSGMAKITALLEFIADELSEYPAKARFMAQFDAMYARDWPAERLLTLEAQINPHGFEYFGQLIREGMEDGSLRRDLHPELTMHAIMNAVVGAQRRLASLGNKVEVEYGQPIEKLLRETIRVLLQGLSAEKSAIAKAAPRATKNTTGKRS